MEKCEEAYTTTRRADTQKCHIRYQRRHTVTVKPTSYIHVSVCNPSRPDPTQPVHSRISKVSVCIKIRERPIRQSINRTMHKSQQAVRVATRVQYAPARCIPVTAARTLRPSCSPSLTLAAPSAPCFQ